MTHKALLSVLFIFCSILAVNSQSKEYTLKSPNKNNEIHIQAGKTLQFSIFNKGNNIIENAEISMLLSNGEILGQNIKIIGKKETPIDETIISPLYKYSQFRNSCNELTLSFKGNYGIIFRAYNEGIAYRFFTKKKGELIIQDEINTFNFKEDHPIYWANTARENLETSSFQSMYTKTTIVKCNKIALTPATIAFKDGVKLTILESDLESYPGMYLESKGNTSLGSHFVKYPNATEKDNIRCEEYVTRRTDYIAKVSGNHNFPWRIFAISEKDTEMPENNLVYALASPNRIGDCSWIKGGKVAWDWWNDWGLTGIDFKAGINQKTYKYYIDFASRHNIEYIILDEGWYEPQKGDVMTVIPELSLKELIEYGKKKNVKLILWAVLNSLDEKLEEACKYYSELGIAGFKVDFLNRDDQKAVEMVYRVAKIAAKYHLTIDYHGVYKPTGLNRTYPNVVNFESVFGMEEVKWTNEKNDMPEYDVTMPYIRMMAGPVDFTPGAMRNATKKDFKAIYYNPMSMGTRSHQAAMYIVYDSPLTMLCDSPTNYEKDETFTNYIARIPTIFDNTKIIDGVLGEYIVSARNKNDNWYIGGLTNWTERDIQIPLSFLNKGTYKAVLLKDGINANKNAEDYKIDTIKVESDKSLNIHMASGGGFGLIIYKDSLMIDDYKSADIEINSSNAKLNEIFNWAKVKARTYVKTGMQGVVNASENKPGTDKVEYMPSYMAGYPFRSAFYSRDYCHQMSGAHLLKLNEENFQMLKAFAKSSTKERKYYPLWAINFDGSIYDVDYRNDNLFVREIPAAFELVEKAYKQYLWTGDERLINDDDLWSFYTHIVNDFVKLHDTKIVNGVAEGEGSGSIFKGTATYNEGADEYPYIESGDGIATQYQAFKCYSKLLAAANKDKESAEWDKKAKDLKHYFEYVWSKNIKNDVYPKGYDVKGNVHWNFGKETTWFIPLKGITDEGKRNKATLDLISMSLIDKEKMPVNIEAFSYIPDVFFMYNMVDEGWKWTKYIIDNCNTSHVVKRGGTNGDYPEVSYTIISNVVENIMGIEPNAPAHEFSIVSRLPKDMEYLEVKNIRIGKNIINAKHYGTKKTTLCNAFGDNIKVRVCFYGNYSTLIVNGKKEKAQEGTLNGEKISFVNVELCHDNKITVEHK